MEIQTQPSAPRTVPDSFVPPVERGPRILARTFYRELQSQGFSHDQILAFASEIIGMVTVEMEPCTPIPSVVKSV